MADYFTNDGGLVPKKLGITDTKELLKVEEGIVAKKSVSDIVTADKLAFEGDTSVLLSVYDKVVEVI